MINKNYDSKKIEAHWRKQWEMNTYFQPSGQGEPYCIVLPPPNVTGSLHMGHGFQVTLMDALIRYQRMCGKNVLWQGGTDHAGIATQMVVERQLLAQGKSRHDLGRELFVEAIWEWKKKSGGMITEQLRYMGASIDWTRERFTRDEHFSAAVEKVFIDLYKQGLIYRGKRLVNWDPQLLTAVSDLEVINQEEPGYLWTIRYPLLNSNDFLLVATTRPETLFGDVAVAVHPDDLRYQSYIGKQIKLPLTDRVIPIIADMSVEPTFGSGCIKITPAHDFNDYATAQRHGLTSINIFTPNAYLNEHVPENFRGLERFVARKKIINDLEQLGLVEKIEAYQVKIPRGDRSGVVIEPYLTDQWFMSMQPLAKTAILTITQGQLDFIPETWRKVCLQWLENIEDWCISRQLWWGHRIPAWYNELGQFYVGKDEKSIRQQYSLDPKVTLKQDEDVLDTWFSSALWPFVTLGWPEATKELASFYPTNVLVTGFDIIFFWVARMLMLGLHFTGKVPFKEVYVTGLIRDHEGQKMSKSKGNVLDPLDVILGISLDDLVAKRTQGLLKPQMAKKIEQSTKQQFPQGIPALGTDALRFTFCALASPTRDIRFDLNRTEGYRNFCNKLWNASRFVLTYTSNQTSFKSLSPLTLSINRAFYSLLQNTIADMHKHFQDYRFDLMAQTIYEFIWNEYCDWYVELAKPILANANSPAGQETLTCLIFVLETCLRLLHPLMPFVTEEIWQTIAPLADETGNSLMIKSYPVFNKNKKDTNAEQDLIWLKSIVHTIRTLRSEMNIAPGKKIPLLLYKGNEKDRENSHLFLKEIMNLAKISEINWVIEKDKNANYAMGLVGNLELFIPMEGLIDIEAEALRLKKEILKIEKEIERAKSKLDNAAFVKNAPPEIIAQEQQRLTDFTAIHTKLQSQLHTFIN
ncbi:valine--tRNA ligase [Rickettsiella endosymbiont of Rhagonycha lignosa]|uniref:valine--tRNA ligase n=1 Tax=Rickettsiella endosymbiont of Rhagonycha lignosa TaxID=3077937 RepID=UPI00313CA3C3